jgi:hypothetical protein
MAVITTRWPSLWFRWSVAVVAVVGGINDAPLVAASGLNPVTVHVRAVGGELVPDAYLALVPKWRPLSRPLLEAVVEKGIWIAHAPPGSYRLIACARGFAPLSQSASIAQDKAANLTVELQPLKRVTGNVSDEQGNPIAGVRIATINAAIAPPLGKLSRLAVDHLKSDWSVTTDKDGSWTLGLPGAPTALLYEAPGFGAEWRLREPADSSALDVSMKSGAELHLIADRSDSNLVVTLVREETNAGSGVPADWQRQIWARWAATPRLTWDSLQPGTYAIYAKYPDTRFFMPQAVKIGAVTLAASESRDLHVTLPPALVPAKSVATLFVENATRKDLGDEVEAFGVDAGGAPRRVDVVTEEASGADSSCT